MSDLTYLEQKIISAIAETHPYSFSEVKYIYKQVKSFDKTIDILKYSTRGGICFSNAIIEFGISAQKAGNAFRNLSCVLKDIQPVIKPKKWYMFWR